ncbi:putative MAPEG superfamily protein [Natronocella acetinitrilica]|uniref:MAPEG superfamily protein n=1 Tax=Natronocella acetinitrilica TaxID=414046 RepID=A0AAE3G5A0_9GAMM|nr:MAPEG family protein [Natronocella acetinitrilica]MCP1676065.1 putative MAPEG superfamily protein [Natronocella acetinitrilica]
MTLAYWIVLVAAVMPVVFAGIAKAGGEAYDNRNPRDWLARQEGWRKRANAAQQNSVEAFAPFAAAVIIAHQLGAGQATINTLAVLFILCRVVYGALYIKDMHSLRSLAWLAGFGCVIALFIVSI